MIDLHTHSSVSDGSLSPSELAKAAAEKGLSLWALTDHDSAEGLAQAEEVSKKAGIAFVPGAELSIKRERGELHLLAYGISAREESFAELLAEASAARKARNERIRLLFRENGIEIDMDRVKEIAGGRNIGRPHFAKYLAETGCVKNIQQAFSRYLAVGKPCYVKCLGLDLEKAAAAVRRAGGVSVLAHPMSLYVSWGKMKSALAEIKSAGVQAIEAWHPGAKVSACKRLEKLARLLGMNVTAGSDFHGESRPDRVLGVTAGGIKIDDRFFTEELKPLIEKAAEKTLF